MTDGAAQQPAAAGGTLRRGSLGASTRRPDLAMVAAAAAERVAVGRNQAWSNTSRRGMGRIAPRWLMAESKGSAREKSHYSPGILERGESL